MHGARGGCDGDGTAREILADGFAEDGPACGEDAGGYCGVGDWGPVGEGGGAEKAGDLREGDVVFEAYGLACEEVRCGMSMCAFAAPGPGV